MSRIGRLPVAIPAGVTVDIPVSYTHLDVYKRQDRYRTSGPVYSLGKTGSWPEDQSKEQAV